MGSIQNNASQDQAGQNGNQASSSLFAKTRSYITNHKRASIEVAGAFAFAGVMSTIGVTAANGAQPVSSDDTQSGAVQLNVSKTTDSSTDGTTPGSDDSSNNDSFAAGASSNSNVSTQVTVNGQDVTVPDNGTVNKTIVNPDGSTSVSVTSNTQSNGTASNSSGVHYNLHVTTHSTSDMDSGEDGL